MPTGVPDTGWPGPSIFATWANRALLVVDVAESVRLMEKDQAGFVSRWLALVDRVKTQVLPQTDGRLVKTLGDGLLLAFDDARSAVSAALAIQKACDSLNGTGSADQSILLRMGVEARDVIVEHDDVYGHGVNVASRLASLAEPGEIVVSQNVRDQITQDLDADIEDLGDCFLRHVSQPVRAYRVGPHASRRAVQHVVSLDQLAPSVAVLPFAPRMAEDEFAVLGDVIAEELIRALSHAPELNLISRLSTAAFRGRTIVLPEIAAHLSADYVLSGSYASDGRQTKIDAELVEAKSGKLLFARRLEGDASAILRSDQDLLGPLAAEICNTVIARELQRSKLQPLATLKAYTLLIGAIALMHRLSPRDFEEARQLLQALIDRGNRHPIPLAWLATWHVLRVQQGWSDDRQRDAYMALECTKRALDMDSECSLALAADGFTHVNLLKRLDIGRERYDLAIAANSSHAFAWLLKGTLHAFMGEGERAVEDTQRALRLTPLDPHRFMYDSLAASACIAAHQYDNALELARRSLRANRKHTSTLRVLAVAQWRLGQHEEAVATGNELLKLEPNLTVGRWLAGAPSAAYPVGQEFARTLREVGIPD